MLRAIVAASLALGGALPAAGQELSRVTERDAFTDQVVGRDLTRTGVTVRVMSDGAITGRAFGAPVSGSWSWRDGYFCREMSWTARSWPMNCQAVYVGGSTVRFVADRGQGDSADLTVE